MPKIDIAAVPLENGSKYPDVFKPAVAGRQRRRIGNAAGLTQFGVNVCTLKPGAATSIRHWHASEDELVYVLQGAVVLCEDGGETLLRPGDAAGWKAGAPNGHCLVNRGAEDAILLEIGTRAATDRATYPDIDMLAVRDEKGSRYTRKNGEPY